MYKYRRDLMLTGVSLSICPPSGYLTAHTKWYNSFHRLMMAYIIYIIIIIYIIFTYPWSSGKRTGEPVNQHDLLTPCYQMCSTMLVVGLSCSSSQERGWRTLVHGVTSGPRDRMRTRGMQHSHESHHHSPSDSLCSRCFLSH